MFISFEGLDGSGKTTQARLLAEALESEGAKVVRVREPGGTPAGERIRELLLDPGEAIDPAAEALLYAAARAQLVADVIAPALRDGAHVVADRFIDSSLAYQGVARGLGVERVLEVNLLATRGIFPDRTVLLRLDQAEAAGAPRPRRRTGSRPRAAASTPTSPGASPSWPAGSRSGSSSWTPAGRRTRCWRGCGGRWACERAVRGPARPARGRCVG